MTATPTATEADLLKAIDVWAAASPKTLAQFFNTLSYLEHIGSRKILASGIEFSAEELRHTFEEAGHALRFKLIAQKLDARVTKNYDQKSLFGGASPKYYFQKLDAIVRSFVRGRSDTNVKHLGYLLVTYLVEKRAATLYPAIHELMRCHELPVSLRSIIADEDRHLEEIEEGLAESGALSPADLEILRSLEESLFSRLSAEVIRAGDLSALQSVR